MLDGVAAGKFRKRTLDIFVNSRGELAAVSGRSWVEVEYRTVLDTTAEVCALVNSFLKERLIPAHEEVSMEAISSGITHGPDKWLTVTVPHICILVGIPNDFVEDRDKMDWMCARACSVIVCTNWI